VPRYTYLSGQIFVWPFSPKKEFQLISLFNNLFGSVDHRPLDEFLCPRCGPGEHEEGGGSRGVGIPDLGGGLEGYPSVNSSSGKSPLA